MSRARVIAAIILLSAPLSASFTVAAEPWQRIPLLDDPRLAVTLLAKTSATPADEDFIGFELHNRTDEPLHVANARYRLDGVTVSTLGPQAKPLRTQGLASGGGYDLLVRGGPAPPQAIHEISIPPGITQRLRYASITSLTLLGFPTGKGWSIEGRAHFEIRLGEFTEPADRANTLATPPVGVPFAFEWLPPDDNGIDALRKRLLAALAQKGDDFADAYLLGALLTERRIASAARLEDLLAALREKSVVVRPTIRQHIETHFAADERVIAFFLDRIDARDLAMLNELYFTPRIRDRRFIQPLIEWIRAEQDQYGALHPALSILHRHHDLMPDPAAVAQELAPIVMLRTRHIINGTFPDKDPSGWAREVDLIVLTRSPSFVKHLVPYLDEKTIVHDAAMTSMLNNGISTRACDIAYNAVLDLLNRPGQRLTMSPLLTPIDAPAALRNPDPATEYPRRDALIAKLKAELTSKN